jgi:hypothetical protein
VPDRARARGGTIAAVRDLIASIASSVTTRLGGGAFRHDRAQRFEARYARAVIERDFPALYRSWRDARDAGALWQRADDPWFQGDERLFETFVEHVRDRRCLEIGSGPFGYLAPTYWIRDRVVIDPLVDLYREHQLEVAGATFFENVTTHAVPAEQPIAELRGTVDGCIVCRNALDHCDDPLTIVANIGEYAAEGCYLLLWSDLWHLDGADEGHRNITRSADAFAALVRGVGFEIVKEGAPVRERGVAIEYGCIAVKRAPRA